MINSNDQYFVNAVKVTMISGIVFLITGSFTYALSQKDERFLSKSLVQKAHEYYKLSMQDKESQHALKHCHYAIAFLHAARYSSDDTNLQNMTGLDMHKFHAKLISRESSLTKQQHKKTKSKPVIS